MVHKLIHRAEGREGSEQGWLRLYHSFSKADFTNPQMVGFGALRRLDDGVLEAGGSGREARPGAPMDVLEVQLYGQVEHRVEGGAHLVVSATPESNDATVRYAGPATAYLDKNTSHADRAEHLQLWIEPQVDLPRHAHHKIALRRADRHNRLQIFAGPEGEKGQLRLRREAYASLASLDAGAQVRYPLHGTGNGVYVFVIDGGATVADEQLSRRDAIGITGAAYIDVVGRSRTEVLLIEVPM